MQSFKEQLRRKWNERKFLCIGLDTEFNKIPQFMQGPPGKSILNFNQVIVEATSDLAGAYKLNTAFYEAYGSEGNEALRDTIFFIRSKTTVPVILDYKRGDIGNTNLGYIQAAFDYFKADAITINGYLGQEAVQPFLDQKDKGVIVLCLTSNPGAEEFQYRKIVCSNDEFYELIDEVTHGNIINAHHIQQELGWKRITGEGDSEERFLIPFYQYVALRVARHWNQHNNCLLVAGAPHAGDIKKLRLLVPYMPFLIPGVGVQQKSVSLDDQIKLVVKAAQDKNGENFIINASRSIIFASNERDFPAAARHQAEVMHNLIKRYQNERIG
ncbi:MAG: orotidine-5'-phosphate decarboxylase [Patescibacteria group bacterium]